MISIAKDSFANRTLENKQALNMTYKSNDRVNFYWFSSIAKFGSSEQNGRQQTPDVRSKRYGRNSMAILV